MSAAPAAEPKPLGARYTDSQREESLIEKIIRERGGEMPRVKFSEVNIPVIIYLLIACVPISYSGGEPSWRHTSTRQAFSLAQTII